MPSLNLTGLSDEDPHYTEDPGAGNRPVATLQELKAALERLKGAATVKMSTDEFMLLMRGKDDADIN